MLQQARFQSSGAIASYFAQSQLRAGRACRL